MTYVLPDLEYDYAALEPHISGQILQLHHAKHHAAYVKKANEAIEGLQEARDKGQWDQIAALERALAFNLSGHVLHSIFWRNMIPKGGDRPSGALAEAIQEHFGGFGRMKQQLIHAAATISGSGWSVLAWDPMARQLVTWQLHDHQNEAGQGGVPLMVIDAWEHAYYLQYHTDKERFFEALWNLWSWDDVSQRFAAARQLDLGLPQRAVALG